MIDVFMAIVFAGLAVRAALGWWFDTSLPAELAGAALKAGRLKRFGEALGSLNMDRPYVDDDMQMLWDLLEEEGGWKAFSARLLQCPLCLGAHLSFWFWLPMVPVFLLSFGFSFVFLFPACWAASAGVAQMLYKRKN